MQRQLTYKLTKENKRPLMANIYHNLDNFLEGSPNLEIVIRKYKSNRSIEQNKRLWKIYQIISENVYTNGHKYSSDIWHEYFKRQFLGCEEYTLPDGSIEIKSKSSAKLDTEAMSEYQNNIQAWAAQEHGIEWLL